MPVKYAKLYIIYNLLCIYHTVCRIFFILICTLLAVTLPRNLVNLRVVRGSGYFPTVSCPIRVNKLPFLSEQFVRMSAKVISLGL